jgi:hypothetical protein
MISLPWESEQVVESSKCVWHGPNNTTTPGIVSLISNLKNPMEFAIIVVDDDETIAELSAAQTGFLGKMKAMANSAAAQANKVQRQVMAGCNRLVASYAVRLVVPVCPNVEFRISSGGLSVSWTSVDAGNTSFKISNLSNKFLNIFSASREIATSKAKAEFLPNSHSTAFAWLWKYQPVVPLPSSPTMLGPGQIKPNSGKSKVLCLSWNLAGTPPPDEPQGSVLPSAYSKYKKQLISFFDKHSQCEVIVVAFQEASPLNAKTVLFKGTDTNYGEAWIEWISDVIACSVDRKRSFEFVRTAAVVQVGLAVAMFVKIGENSRLRAQTPMTALVRTGNLGLTGNKGCVAVRAHLTLDNSNFSISVLNVHLASGDGKGDFRRAELGKIVNESSFGEDKFYHFFDSSLAVVTGDLNARTQGETDGLLIGDGDELLARMKKEGSGYMFFESPIEFPATYKLVPGQNGELVFDTTRKQAWCDRVLYRSGFVGGSDRFACTEYDSLREIDFSDHTPIFAVFELMETDNVEADGPSTVASRPPEVQFGIGECAAEEEDSDNDSDLYDKE